MGAFIGSRRGRLWLLASVGVALAALLPMGTWAAGSATRAKGLDVSNWNGRIAWAKVAGAGYRFAFGKATEGTTYTDTTYTTNRNGSETAGLFFGAYHFARPAGAGLGGVTASAITQANHFLAVAGPQPGELPPVLDLEATGNLSKPRLLAWTLAWLGQIYARTGVNPFVYTSPNFWKANLANSTEPAAAGTDLWVAHWTNAADPLVPAQNWDGGGWTFWQWTNCASIPGITKRCSDADRMNGANLAAVAIQPYAVGLPLLSTPPTVVGQPSAGQLLAAVPGTWEGGKPLQFAYQWRRCDAAGANCAAITAATSESYRPVSADVGHALTVVATATSAAGSATAESAPTAAVSAAGTPATGQPANLAPPQIIGTAQAGQDLTSSSGTWSGSPTSYAYRWRRCNAGGATCVAIQHATHSHYTLTPDDIGSTLSLVVTATGTGGSASATAAQTGIVVAAPLPPVSIDTQTVRRGIAGNVQTADGRAVATWQPGAVPVGKTVTLGTFGGALSLPGTEVSLSVAGLSKGFKWPVDVMYAQPQPHRTVLGYSTDGKVYHPLPALQPAALPPGTAVGWYVDSANRTHVLTRTPLQLALFKQGAFGDPTYTSPNGPTLNAQRPLEVLPHGADHTLLLLTRLSLHAQARLSASVLGRGGRIVPILGSGSRLGVRLGAGRAFRVAQAYRARPGTVIVRLRLNARGWRPGAYRLRVVALDPWGRRKALTMRFRYP
ncbi:MAG TPA: glycoside hydrolase family 25 protein [Gaiellaceae bacterium]|nr:glycoside hydrolase family 25 protein [Gaiellaceae bacterium]